MSYRRFFLPLMLCLAASLPAQAGFKFGKQAKSNPAERVPQLLATVKTDTDEEKRVAAARELRDFDPTAYPDIVPILIDVLQNDTKPSVRAEAAQTLGKLRPVSQDVGMALENATHEPSFRVRWQARSALMGYRFSGYHGTPKPEEATPAQATGKAPPAPPLPPARAKRSPAPPVPQTRTVLPSGETPPPPLAVPAPPADARAPVVRMPAPVPTATPKLQTPPPAVSDQGPDLPPR
jgi:hypothetical protein